MYVLYVPMSGTAGSQSVCIFSFARHQFVFPSRLVNIYSHQCKVDCVFIQKQKKHSSSTFGDNS